MKRIILVAVAVALLTACEKPIVSDEDTIGTVVVDDEGNAVPTKKFTFTIKGNFSDTWEQTRGYLQADGKDMTDVWVFDYIGDELQQTIHQTASDADFGNPTINAAYGDHTIYFVASRGDSPVIDGTTIFWAKPSDTFWASRSITIAPATATNQSVSLQRVATRLRLTVTDEIPATLAQICITPSHWYYGIDYLTGEATDDRQTERTINVPASYIGTTGQLYANFYSMSPSSAWQTDITMKAKDGDGGVISQIGIADVPLERNRVTNYSGTLFNANRTVAISVDSDWGEDISGTW
jgi:hypothetical protein